MSKEGEEGASKEGEVCDGEGLRAIRCRFDCIPLDKRDRKSLPIVALRNDLPDDRSTEALIERLERLSI